MSERHGMREAPALRSQSRWHLRRPGRAKGGTNEHANRERICIAVPPRRTTKSTEIEDDLGGTVGRKLVPPRLASDDGSRKGTRGKEIHEIYPVKFGGDPTDPANKIALDPGFHRRYASPWWRTVQKNLEKDRVP